jgi:small subunit ribosomal protein S9
MEGSAQGKSYGTGRRKTAAARVWLGEGTGQLSINRRDPDEFFRREVLKTIVLQPLELVGMTDKIDVQATTRGGGLAGQAGAIRHGIARALCVLNPDLRTPLKRAGFLTRDAREKERKKYGQPGARKRFQFSKR